MMNDWATYVMVGMQDAFSPVQMCIPGILLLIFYCIAASEKFVLALFSTYFLAFLVFFNLVADLSFFLPLSSSEYFTTWTGFLYSGIGIVFLMVACFLAYQWVLMARGHVGVSLPRHLKMPKLAAGFFAFVLAVMFSISSTAWPVTMQIALQGALTFTHGRLFDSLALLLIYELVRNIGVVLLFVAVILYWCGVFKPLKEEKSLIISCLAAYYLAIGGTLIYFLFLNRG